MNPIGPKTNIHVTAVNGAPSGANVPQLEGDAATASSGTVNRTLSHTYDAANRLTNATLALGGTAGWSSNVIRKVETGQQNVMGGFRPQRGEKRWVLFDVAPWIGTLYGLPPP